METKAGHGVGLLLVIIGIIAIFLYVLPRGGLLYSLIANTIVGFIVIFLVNGLFGLGITYDLLVFVFVAIFGLLGVAIIIIMNLLGFKR
jgi:hypothetical protein